MFGRPPLTRLPHSWPPQVLTGDMLLAAAFVSYAGPFTARYRGQLIAQWLKFLADRQAPTSGLTDPLKVRWCHSWAGCAGARKGGGEGRGCTC